MAKVISNYRPADLRTALPAFPRPAQRTVAQVLAPDAWDAGQVVREVLYNGVVWAHGPEHGKGRDSRWVVCEDGVVRLALLDKAPAKDGGAVSFVKWAPSGFDYAPANAQPFAVESFGGAAAELADQPSIFDLALAA